MPSETNVRGALSRAGFRSLSVLSLVVTPDLQDLFLYSGEHRPELYLNPAVRANISFFALFAAPAKLNAGLAQLAADLQSGAFASVRPRYTTDMGDMRILWRELTANLNYKGFPKFSTTVECLFHYYFASDLNRAALVV